MYNFIKSNFMKNYLESIKFEFTDTQKATVIWNRSDFSLHEKLSELKKIADETGDKKLKDEILERIEYEKDKYNAIVESSDGFIYEVVSLSSNDNALFMDYKDAENYLKTYVDEFKEVCNIHKRKLIRYNPKIVYIRDYDDYIGCVSYGIDKEIYHLASYEINSSDIELDNHRFENKYINIQFPFNKGVTVIYEDELYVVYGNLNPKSKDSILSYSDVSVIGYKYTDTNGVIKCKIPLLELELKDELPSRYIEVVKKVDEE